MWNRYRQQIEVPAYEEKKVEQLVKEAKNRIFPKEIENDNTRILLESIKIYQTGCLGNENSIDTGDVSISVFREYRWKALDRFFYIRSIAEFDRRSGIVRFVQSRNERTFVDCEKVFGSSVGCQASGVWNFRFDSDVPDTASDSGFWGVCRTGDFIYGSTV